MGSIKCILSIKIIKIKRCARFSLINEKIEIKKQMVSYAWEISEDPSPAGQSGENGSKIAGTGLSAFTLKSKSMSCNIETALESEKRISKTPNYGRKLHR